MVTGTGRIDPCNTNVTHTHISFYFIEDGGCESGCNPNAECVTNKCKCKKEFSGDGYTCYGKYVSELCTWASGAQSSISDFFSGK